MKRDAAAALPGDRARFELVPGAVVAEKYRVERVLGEGGMGVVVAATHLGLEQRVAIKFLLPHAMGHKEAVERFQREAKVAAKVKSEHVARVHDVGTLGGGEPFIVMEYLEGSELRELLRQSGRLPLADACEIILQACEALAEVHAAGIVHRDLKPSNLFVTRRADGSPCVKLLDFGISKFAFDHAAASDPALTATATIMGSPSYMSPEQIKSTKEVDARTDVWSLGAVLYEAVTGRPAFRSETVLQVCAMIASDDPLPPSSLRDDIPPQLDRTILDCLQKQPEKRARLVDLARCLADFAPERARVSLERIEAVLGEPQSKPRSAVAPPMGEAQGEELPILPLATSPLERRGFASSPGASGHTRRRRHSGIVFFGLLASALFGVGLYTGRINARALRGQIAGATRVVASVVDSGFPVPEPVESTGAALATPAPAAAPSEPAAGLQQPPSEGPSAGAMSAPSAAAPSVPDELGHAEEPPPAPSPAPSTAVASAPAHFAAPPHPMPLPPKHHPSKPKNGAKPHHHRYF